MLLDAGMQAKVVIVHDNNDIDREVCLFQPTHVIIEALWVVPEKFLELHQIHPDVKWIIRVHSELPFLSSEGIALEWLSEYTLYPKVIVATNSNRLLRELRFTHHHRENVEDFIVYLPNFYSVGDKTLCRADKDTVNVGCFGSLRDFKNHITQAIAAMRFAERINRAANFYISTVESDSTSPILRNLRALFKNSNVHRLVEVPWKTHDDFLATIESIDIGLQVSFTETFNIVAADLVSLGIPIVTSREVRWSTPIYANPSSSEDIANKMMFAWNHQRTLSWLNRKRLKNFSAESRKIWLNFLK
jgi:hypothetical protein